jgi:predicted bacteriocin transport accessory protein
MILLISCSSNNLESIPGDKESDWEISNLIKISRDELKEMMESDQDFYVYFGRPSCPDCREFYPKFKAILEKSKVEVYYYSTEAKASEKAEMRDFIKSLGMKGVPSIVHIKENAVAEIYDGQEDQDLKKFGDVVIGQ